MYGTNDVHAGLYVPRKEIDFMSKKISAVIVAAGASSRMGCEKSKLLLNILGKTVIRLSLEALNHSEVISEIILVVREQDKKVMETEASGIEKVSAVIAGGETRQASVYNGVMAAAGDYIAVHDGARPLVTEQEIADVCRDALLYGAATLACVPKDTVKTAGEDGFAERTPPRDSLRLIATPQVFEKGMYLRALHQAGGAEFTDDCQLIENSGGRVYLTPGEYTNIKITTPEDIGVAQEILKRIGK